jgi:hypothetical protein
MTTDQEKDDCMKSIAFGLNRAASWRDKIDGRYPGDPRNALAAECLRTLAAKTAGLSDEAWLRLRPAFCGLTVTRWREAVAQAGRQVGFYQEGTSFACFLKTLFGVLQS